MTDDFRNIVIKTGAGGQVTRLKDVARVELGADTYALRALLDNKAAAAIPIFQRPGSNAIAISEQVRAKMLELKKDFPQGVDYQIVYDPTVFVRGSIHAVVHTLLEAILLVVMVVILFLQTWRASIIPLIAVPVSLIGTFAVMHLFGFSLNALSLFGLVLAIGIVVDDAIVVVENVERNIAQRLETDRRHPAGDARGHRPDHRNRAGAVRGVRADRFHQRLDRPVLQAVRAHHRDQHRHLGIQLADPFTGPRRPLAQGARCGSGSPDAGFERGYWAEFSDPSTASSGASPKGYVRNVGRVIARWRHRILRLRRTHRPHLSRLRDDSDRLRAAAGQAISRGVRTASGCRDARSHGSVSFGAWARLL